MLGAVRPHRKIGAAPLGPGGTEGELRAAGERPEGEGEGDLCEPASGAGAFSTGGGTFDYATGHYLSSTVVFASLASSRPARGQAR